MAKTNTKTKAAKVFTHEGARANRANAEEQLRRTVMACMLFEDTFYEDGLSVADRIAAAAESVPLATVIDLAVEARRRQHLRHAPLWLTVAALNHPEFRGARTSSSETPVSELIACGIDEVCQRADDMTELLALYWKGGKKPLAAALKEGLARAFTKFNQYKLAKYANRGDIRLRDVMFLVHPKPSDDAQAAVFKMLADDTLPPAETWEVALSGGADKRDTFTTMLTENKLGGLAVLRNLRNMKESGVGRGLVAETLLEQAGKAKLLPFQYLAAARAVPGWEDIIEPAMLSAMTGAPKLPGKTVLLVDTSGSMGAILSQKSMLSRSDAAAGLAIMLREVCEEVVIACYDDVVREVPPRRGFALCEQLKGRDAGTDTGMAVIWANAFGADRIVVITDEQSSTRIPAPVKGARGYIMNVASYEHGIGYRDWTHVTGFSENLVRYIVEMEAMR